MLDTRLRPSRLCFSQFATRTVDNTVDLYATKPDTCSESGFLPISPAFDAPVRGVSVGISTSRLAWKTRMAWLPDGEKNFKDIFIRLDTAYERDRHTHTDRQTDRQTPHDGIGRAYASHRAAKMLPDSSFSVVGV